MQDIIAGSYNILHHYSQQILSTQDNVRSYKTLHVLVSYLWKTQDISNLGNSWQQFQKIARSCKILARFFTPTGELRPSMAPHLLEHRPSCDNHPHTWSMHAGSGKAPCVMGV